MDITNFIQAFQNLNVNKTGRDTAPHKPILLLSVMDMIESGEITSSFVPISEELQRRFRQNWRIYVPKTSRFNCALQYPFFHLSSSSFWHLIRTSEFEDKAPTSIKALKRNFKGAEIDRRLFEIMIGRKGREELRNVLINTYLSDSHSIAAEPLLSALALFGMFAWLMMNA